MPAAATTVALELLRRTAALMGCCGRLPCRCNVDVAAKQMRLPCGVGVLVRRLVRQIAACGCIDNPTAHTRLPLPGSGPCSVHVRACSVCGGLLALWLSISRRLARAGRWVGYQHQSLGFSNCCMRKPNYVCTFCQKPFTERTEKCQSKQRQQHRNRQNSNT